MENKTAENTEGLLKTEPVLVNAIVDILSKEVESIKELLSRKDLMEKN